MSEQHTPNIEFYADMLKTLGHEEAAQHLVDSHNYDMNTPSNIDEVVDVPKPHEMVATAHQDAHDEYADMGYKDLIGKLKSAHEHKEKMHVVTKNGDVVSRNKKVAHDKTTAIDTIEALGTKLGESDMPDNGLLTVLLQVEKQAGLSDDEVTLLIDKIIETRENNAIAAEVAAAEENPFDQLPDVSTRRSDIAPPAGYGNHFDHIPDAEPDEDTSVPVIVPFDQDEDDEDEQVALEIEQTDAALIAASKTPEKMSKRNKVIAGVAAGLALIALGLGLKHSADNDTSVKGSTDSTELVVDSTDTSTGTTTPAPSPETTTVTIPAGINLEEDQPWTVAHALQPGNEVAVMQPGIDAYNFAHSTDFALRPHNGTTMIIDGKGHIVNTSERTEINKLIIESLNS